MDEQSLDAGNHADIAIRLSHPDRISKGAKCNASWESSGPGALKAASAIDVGANGSYPRLPQRGICGGWANVLGLAIAADMNSSPSSSPRNRSDGQVWDLPTRLFHWLLVGLFAFSWWCAKHDQMDWHRLSGITVLGLLLFRLMWGVIGGSTARFAQFVKAPRHVAGYLRNKLPDVPATVGHNPLGAYSVIALLGTLVIQVGSGLFAVDVDGLESGPLSYLLSFDQGRVAAHIHGVSFNLLLALIALHLLAIGYYRLRGRNLLLPMVIGRDRTMPPGSEPLRTAPLLHLVIAVAIAGGVAWWVSRGLPL